MEFNVGVKEAIKSEFQKAPTGDSHKKELVVVAQRNVGQSIHSSMPRMNLHQRAQSECEVLGGRGLGLNLGAGLGLNLDFGAKAGLGSGAARKPGVPTKAPEEAEDPFKQQLSPDLSPSNGARWAEHRCSNLGRPLPQPEESRETKRPTEVLVANEGSTKATQEDTQSSYNRMQDSILQDREKLIQYNFHYMRKHKTIPPTTIDYYKFVKLIGKGAFGKVTLGIHKLTGKHVAIKTIEKSYMKDDFSRKKVFREVYILKKIRHANVIRLLEVFESPKHLLIVMEYAGGGDLLQHVKRCKRLGEREAKKLFRQIVYGLGHVHARSVLHRDVKLDNILLDNDHGVKICDFGVSKILDKTLVIKEQCGTPAYIAPEIISDHVLRLLPLGLPRLLR